MIRGSFFKNIRTVFFGAVSTQLVSIGILLTLTRIFKPEDYAILAIFTSFTAIVSLVVTGRYEIAILSEKITEEAQKALRLVSFIALGLSPLIGGISFLILEFVVSNPKYPSLAFSLLITIFSWVQSGSICRLLYLDRVGKFKERSVILFLATLVSGLTVIVCGLMGLFGSYALILGPILNHVFIWSLFSVIGKEKLEVKFDTSELIKFAKLRYKYPVNLIPSSLLLTSSMEFKTFATAKYFLAGDVGNLGMFVKIEGLFHRVIGTTFSDVYRREAALNFNEGKSNKSLFLKTFLSLVGLGFIPAMIFIFLGEEIFTLILGKQWSGAGIIAETMGIAFYFTFVISPMSTIFHVTQSQIYDLITQIFYFILMVTSFSFYFMGTEVVFQSFLKLLVLVICIKSCFELFLSYKACLKTLDNYEK